ncbi:TPA: hypothetical protein ACGVAU_004250 [Vibrio vulnificus]|uniref:Transcriptional regulator n=2 Tax=Vibrio TaxID=662 RepID=A0A0C1W3L5_9VIBR|nr:MULTISPECIES: hypothetical protein [Vibrio]EKO3597346.1 hypothetical protein [Vibrio metschnikovii]EKQ3696128.1 hypothetical protein [Vibrio vulnificus]NAW55462.1 hypothetical protein [Vibrio sp. V41_P2S12T139]NAW93442.1 hypothetical protein [Vibrio sp. V42_P2S4T144]ABX77104.1 hypothetical protein BMSC_0007 [Vibrio sp. 0908]
MTNNEKLKIIQKHFKLKAQDVADICYKTSVNTIWAWRTTPESARFRTMNDGEYEHLVNWLIKNERITDETELNALLEENTN